MLDTLLRKTRLIALQFSPILRSRSIGGERLEWKSSSNSSLAVIESDFNGSVSRYHRSPFQVASVITDNYIPLSTHPKGIKVPIPEKMHEMLFLGSATWEELEDQLPKKLD